MYAFWCQVLYLCAFNHDQNNIYKKNKVKQILIKFSCACSFIWSVHHQRIIVFVYEYRCLRTLEINLSAGEYCPMFEKNRGEQYSGPSSINIAPLWWHSVQHDPMSYVFLPNATAHLKQPSRQESSEFLRLQAETSFSRYVMAEVGETSRTSNTEHSTACCIELVLYIWKYRNRKHALNLYQFKHCLIFRELKQSNIMCSDCSSWRYPRHSND